MVGETKSGKNFDYTNYEEDIWVGYRYFNTVKQSIVYLSDMDYLIPISLSANLK